MGFYSYILLSVSLGAIGASYLSRQARRANIRKQAQAGFESYKARQYMSAFPSEMSAKEAYLILGIKENATKDKVISAHKKLMLLNHPDNGGSTFLATKINEAKETILQKID